MQISDEARTIQRSVYEKLVATYLLQNMEPAKAIHKAGHMSMIAAVYFDQKFPSATTINVRAQQPADSTDEPSSSDDEEVLTGWAPGSIPRPPPPKK